MAQIGAVLRRDFSHALLRAVGGVDDPALQSALDRLADADIFIAEDRGPQANYRFKHALILDAPYDSLLKGRRQVLHRRAAEVLRDDPERAAAEPEVIAHHFTEAGLDDLAIEWWGKAGDQALRRSAFQEAIAHLGKAIAMADKAGGLSPQGQRLHVAYGNALIAARGYGAPETTAAFARARESAFGDKDAPERLAVDDGLWAGSHVRGELPSMRRDAAAFLSHVEARPDSAEAGVAHRAAGLTHWFAGEYREARGHLERAVALFEPGRRTTISPFASDRIPAWRPCSTSRSRCGRWATSSALFPLVATLTSRMAGLAHVHTRVFGEHLAAMFELMRGNCSCCAARGRSRTIGADHDLSLWRAVGVFLDGLARAAGPLGQGVVDMRRGIQLQRDQNALTFDGLIKIALAEAEATRRC